MQNDSSEMSEQAKSLHGNQIITSTNYSQNYLTSDSIVKKINSTINDDIYSKLMFLYSTVGGHKNIVSLDRGHLPSKKDAFLFFEYMTCNFSGFFKSENIKSLTNSHCKYFAKQLLEGIEFLHSIDVIHESISSDNIWLNSQCDLKIMDYGEYRIINKYDCSRNDICLSPERCENMCIAPTKEIDIWDAGVFLSQLNNSGKDTYPRSDHVRTFENIVKIIGLPDQEQIEKATKKWFLKIYPDWTSNPNKILCNSFLMENDECFSEYWSFLKNLLQYKEKRWSSKQLLAHPYIDIE